MTPKPQNLTLLSRGTPESPCCAHTREREEPCHGRERAQASVQGQVSVQGQDLRTPLAAGRRSEPQVKPSPVQAVKLRSREGAGMDAGIVPSDNPSLGNNRQQLGSGCRELWTPRQKALLGFSPHSCLPKAPRGWQPWEPARGELSNAGMGPPAAAPPWQHRFHTLR